MTLFTRVLSYDKYLFFYHRTFITRKSLIQLVKESIPRLLINK